MLNKNNFELELKLDANVYYLDSSNTVLVASGEDGFYSTTDGSTFKQANTFSLKCDLKDTPERVENL